MVPIGRRRRATRTGSGLRAALEEDRIVQNALQIGLGTTMSPALDLPLDKGSLRFRKGVQALIEREATAAQVSTGATRPPLHSPADRAG